MRRLLLATTPPPQSQIDFPLYIFANEYELDMFMYTAYSYGDYGNLMNYLKEVMMLNSNKESDYGIYPLECGIEIYVDYILIGELFIGESEDYIGGSTYVPGNSSLTIMNTEIKWDAWNIGDNYAETTFSYGIKSSLADSVVYRCGMTWRSFCESEYNTVGFRIDKHPYTDEDVIVHDDGILIKGGILYCKPTDLIESTFYTLF